VRCAGLRRGRVVEEVVTPPSLPALTVPPPAGVGYPDTINLRRYLQDVLPRLGDWPINRVGELTPLAWKAAQKA